MKYKNEIGVILINLSNEPYVVAPGERIAQGVLKEFTQAEFLEVDQISQENSRGGGFGHSGTM